MALMSGATGALVRCAKSMVERFGIKALSRIRKDVIVSLKEKFKDQGES